MRPRQKAIKKSEIQIPETEMEFIFSRSSGAGGQNVNKVNTKATIRWNLWKSNTLDENQKNRIAKNLKTRLDTHGDLLVYSQESKSQHQNRALAVEKLNNLIRKALREKRPRVLTEPTRISHEVRIKKKKITAQKKKLRKQPQY